jgi:nicotinate-nucleotide adenylyltransferase
MQIGLFGGSFNPPHVGHLIVAEAVRDQFALDAVWWIPNATPPHKPDAELVAPRHRRAMTEAAIAGNSAFRLCDVELAREGISYTADTVRVLQREHPEATFSLIIGSDSLDRFGTWHRPEEIASRVSLLVYARLGSREAVADPAYANAVRYAAAPALEVSSTEIRARCQAGRSIRYLVPESVRTYIESNALYTD